MKPGSRFAVRALAITMTACGATTAAAGAEHDLVVCDQIKTAAQLQAMKDNLAGSYCLANDINAGSIANFTPIGTQATPFTGKLFGNNHVISNLRINSSVMDVGLFGAITGAQIQDVRLVNTKVTATLNGGANVGGVVGAQHSASSTTGGSTIMRVSVTGQIKCTGSNCSIGGVAGNLVGADLSRAVTVLSDSWSSAEIIDGTVAGDLVGAAVGVLIARSYATGSVTCTDCAFAGGLAGQLAAATIDESYATAPVTSGEQATSVGGLVGLAQDSSTVRRSYAAGPVTATFAGPNTSAGGLIGRANGDVFVVESYAAGLVKPGAGGLAGGLVGSTSGSTFISATNAYWDRDTTGWTTSAQGKGTSLTTLQLRAALPAGFGAAWAITKTLSYPFLNDPHIDFASPLATLVVANKVFTFLPISQFSASEYGVAPFHATPAALATVYTMIARAIGIADHVPELEGVKIDKYFWHDSTQTTTWAGPVTAHAALGPVVGIPSSAKLNTTNVVGRMNAHELVILRGTYTKNGGVVTHYMLGTLYTQSPGNPVDTVVANDPATGLQVEIDPATKKVISPPNFPLANFTVNGYQAVAVH